MTSTIYYKLKQIIGNQYNRPNEKRHHKSIIFVIENLQNGNETVEKELTMLPELLSDLGTANTSDFILKQIPSDFLFLNDIFE